MIYGRQCERGYVSKENIREDMLFDGHYEWANTHSTKDMKK